MSAITSVKGITSGAVFGGALTAAGMYSPAIITGQLRLENFHMLTTFLVACASSTLAILFAKRKSLTTCKPRTPSSLSRFPYDGNLIGGAILGCGMAISGACTGTVLPQLVTGIRSAPYVFAGQLLGGILFSKFGKPLVKTDLSKERMNNPTVYEQLGTEKSRAIAIFESLCISIIAAAQTLLPSESATTTLVSPIAGGLLIGGSQFTSLALTANTLGISTAYEQVGDLFWWLFNPGSPVPSLKDCSFAFGTVLGSYGLSLLVNIPAPVGIRVGNEAALFGGVLLVIGARLAGGCTSGHGISGMAMLSVSSILTVAAMFAGGIGLSLILG